jgi:serine/threonine protein phosphatase 1
MGLSMLVAVGDVHGQLRKLTQLLTLVQSAMKAGGLLFGRDWNYLFVGDYIDRGPQSMEVVERVRRLQAKGAICLLGNHEDIALDEGAPDETATFLSYGGETAARAPGSIFRDHLAWFASLPLFYETEAHVFVHAGVKPGVPLTDQVREQDRDVLLWIREPFLTEQRDFGKYIVHGHTPTRQATPDVRENRCNLDTGAGHGSRLSAALFELSTPRPLQIFSV